MSYTTPHYYPKYEIYAIENFLVEDPFKKIIRIFSYDINLIATVVIVTVATIRQNSAHQRCAIRAMLIGFLDNRNRIYLKNFAIHIIKFDSKVIGQTGSIFNSNKQTIIN